MVLTGAFISLIVAVVTSKPFPTTFNIGRILGGVVGVVFVLSLLSLLIGIVPYLFLRKKISNPEIIIFGILFIFIGIFVSIGSFL